MAGLNLLTRKAEITHGTSSSPIEAIEMAIDFIGRMTHSVCMKLRCSQRIDKPMNMNPGKHDDPNGLFEAGAQR